MRLPSDQAIRKRAVLAHVRGHAIARNKGYKRDIKKLEILGLRFDPDGFYRIRLRALLGPIDSCINNAMAASKKGQIGVPDAAAQARRRVGDRPKGIGERAAQVLDIVGSAVREPRFGEVPHAFVGVELRGVRRKVLEAETGHPTAEGADGITAVNLAVVPDDDHGPAQVAQQVPKKVTHLCVLDVLGMEAPIEAHAPAPRADRDAGDDRDLVPSIAMPDDRRLAARRPGPPHGRNQQEARFVDEDEMGAQPRSVFFTRGQASRFHCSMAASSRSRARVWGFCGVHSS
jgi:hypothetical protein